MISRECYIINQKLPASSNVKKNYTCIKRIGEGSFGKTFLYKHKKTGELVVIKIIDISKDTLDEVIGEVKVLKKLAKNKSHKNILHLKDYEVIKDKYLNIISDYIPSIDFQKIINDSKYYKLINEPLNLLKIMKQILEGLVYIHKNKFAHMDIKPENIIINPDTFNIIIIDFGLSCYAKLCNIYGTAWYMAPEEIIYRYKLKITEDALPISILKKSDIYSLGLTLHEIINGPDKPPFKINPKLLENKQIDNKLVQMKKGIKLNYKSHINKEIDNSINKLIESMLRYDYKKRPSAKQALTELNKIIKVVNEKIK